MPCELGSQNPLKQESKKQSPDELESYPKLSFFLERDSLTFLHGIQSVYPKPRRQPHRVSVIAEYSLLGDGFTTRVQILDEIDCISHSTNTLGKDKNLIILPLAMGK